MRDFWIALVTCAAAVVLKVLKGRLSFALSKQNAIEAIFPVVVLLAVFGGIEIFKAARKLMNEVANETVEVAVDSGLLNAQGGTIVKPVRIIMPWYRVKIVSMAAVLIILLTLMCVFSWKLYIPSAVPQAASASVDDRPSPSPTQTPFFTAQPTVSPRAAPTRSRKQTSTPCSAEDRLLGRC
jgi:hypothetical protein